MILTTWVSIDGVMYRCYKCDREQFDNCDSNGDMEHCIGPTPGNSCVTYKYKNGTVSKRGCEGDVTTQTGCVPLDKTQRKCYCRSNLCNGVSI
uniref:Protein quiver n=1 Tax=Acrobeloides nanus TaxID=290746 RepID=A0A914C680_9BILA